MPGHGLTHQLIIDAKSVTNNDRLVSNSLNDYIAINEALALGYPSGLETDYAGASGFEYNDVLVQPTSLLPSRPGATSVHTNLGECLDSSLLPSSIIAHTELLQATPALSQSTYPSFRGATVSRGANNTALKKWEYAQEYGPRVIWPPEDRDNNPDFDSEGVMPVLSKSIDTLVRTAVFEPVFQEILHFYSTYLSRIYYDYAVVNEDTMGWILERFKLSKAGKYAILATATLFRSNYEQSPSTRSLRDHTKELHAIALKQLDLELNSIEVSPQAKLVALEEMTRYEYFANTSSNYFPHLTQSASTVREILQSDTIDLLSLSGNDTHDIRCFAWCDITNSMATSRPTLLNYESNLECTQHFDWEDAHANPSKGIEWIYGCPDVIAVLMARTIALKHLKISKEERLSRGAKLEQLIFGWRFRPTHAKGSVMRVARVGVQEMWRHAAIIHIHQAIFRSDPTHSVVRDSVKNIIKIASTLKPGVNPDCFLSIPYFIAGAFAISPKDRYTLKSRIIGCGNEPILRNLAVNLDDVWARTDSTGRFSSWSDKENSAIFF
ncbi:Fungal specific transcription factor domain, partial [Rhizoctonia solani]